MARQTLLLLNALALCWKLGRPGTKIGRWSESSGLVRPKAPCLLHISHPKAPSGGMYDMPLPCCCPRWPTCSS